MVLLASVSEFDAQPSPGRNPDVSNKALITKEKPPMTGKSTSADAAELAKLANDYYAWRNENYPVQSSEAGLHTWDDRLTDYAPAKIAERSRHEHALLEKVRAGQRT